MSAALLPDRWKQLRPLLDQALDLEGRARSDYLERIAREAPELLADLRRLLSLHDDTRALAQPAAEMVGEQVLTEPGTRAAIAHRHLNRRIGPYMLRRMVGSGGMGAVYEGERVEGGFRQRVAVKLIGGVHPHLHERFARERQILAELRHPNIPQLFDGGETDDGMPYFVLEYVEGINIIDYADGSGADLDARLALLVKVAEALAYAHRRKVLHRDIKPSNILVTDEGAVKLLDFGISKLLDDASQPTLTRQVLGPMTPEYAAPEQFRGEELGVATDIYQFGVLLFRLLGGRSPYRREHEEGLALSRAVCDEAPRSLLALLESGTAASSPSASAEGRRRSLRQRRIDLDRIARRCLEKLPARRYPSMEALIADLEAVRGDTAPEARLHSDRRRLAWGGIGLALLLAVAGSLALWGPPRLMGADPWSEDDALIAFGLRRDSLHESRPETVAMVERALRAEARGDLPSARALLETAHRSDPRTPVPAILLGYWGSASVDETTKPDWQAQARKRLDALDDPQLDLLLAFVSADAGGDYENALRYAAAILELRPDAWFMHYARAHMLHLRGLHPAALRELQQIESAKLGHRKLVDAIADRAAFGDPVGARELAKRLTAGPDDPTRSLLEARLSYSAGDLAGARAWFGRAVERAQAVAYFEIEARGLLYLGVVEGSLGDYDAAVPSLREARERLIRRGQRNYAVDASLALAQIADLHGDEDAVAREIALARELRGAPAHEAFDPMIELHAARLLRQPPQAPADAPAPVGSLL
jgi:serine/threonine protein kinase